jgi:hypothetical protein
MTSRDRRQAAALFAAVVFLVSCGGPSAPSVVNPAPIPTSQTPPPLPPPPSQLSVSTRCVGPFRPGTYNGVACVAEVSETVPPPTATYHVRADLRIFGGPAEFDLPQCPACGGPPWTFDIDLRIPSDMGPGVKSFPVWVTDAQGRRADTSAAVEIVPMTPAPSPSPLTLTTRCFGPFRPGTYYGLACVAEVSQRVPPHAPAYRVRADLRIFGGPAEVEFPQCPACGGPPVTFDIDLRIPSDMAPGVKSFPVWVTDAGGNRAETTAAVEIVAR